MSDLIQYEVDGRTALITINRPQKMNSLTPEMRDSLREAFVQANADESVWVIVFTGTGDRAFCSGSDLGSNISRLTDDPATGLKGAIPDPSKRWFSDIYKPIICAVNGVAVGGGVEMMLGTDIRVAADHATFALREVARGIVPAGGSHVRLPRQVPWAVAMEIMLLGDPIDAARAYSIGLVNRVVPGPEVLATAHELAARLVRNGPVAVRTAKEAMVRSLELEGPFSRDYYLSGTVFHTEDAREGPKAFLEKREPRFTGR
ncbi:enoyl-CoA hydratase/isomerase family protein [Nocardioides halotolerans]|uniref:enoyl-CoA hydratase/isomerase family protein n=1 Tax=Nocardioides halotolerans TaxID=433660 RepID=UPI00040BC513|nr:enoyl-CoA hydratase-related protein [Nocardioides halotolerans]